MKKLTTEDFIKKAHSVHGDKYDYSKVNYINSREKVCIICPTHGEFWQNAGEHLQGHGCDMCGGTGSVSTESFIKRATNVHGNKYDYSKVNYINSTTKVCVICKEHGEFWQYPFSHLNGCGCPKCSGMNKTNEDIINEFKSIHGDKYDYSKVEYCGNNKKVCIICKEHGEFWQTPAKHLQGQGCPKCGIENRRKKQFLTEEDFITKSRLVWGDKYDYSKVEYISMRNKVCIICPKHGEFWQYPFDHIDGHGCPRCGLTISKAEDEICDYIQGINKNIKIIRHDRTVLGGKEIDIYLPEINIGIEYNGLKWHSEEFGKDYRYHIEKLNEANKNGIKLIQIFEDEYLKNKQLVLNKISHLLGVSNGFKIMARKCTIKEVKRDDSMIFLNKYHIQGYGKCSISYGCYYQGFLVAVMSFKHYNGNIWELVRFASDYHYICQGIGGKLFSYFIKDKNPQKVKTFADRRWTISIDNNLYTKLNFKFDGLLKPDYRYINPQSPNDRIHKANFRKRSLHRRYNLPMKMKEREMIEELGFKKIWDCGLIRYIWKKEE